MKEFPSFTTAKLPTRYYHGVIPTASFPEFLFNLETLKNRNEYFTISMRSCEHNHDLQKTSVTLEYAEANESQLPLTYSERMLLVGIRDLFNNAEKYKDTLRSDLEETFETLKKFDPGFDREQ